MANRPGTKHATTMEMIKINDILKNVLVIHEGGLCSYIPGYNDARVAMEVGSHLSKHSVMGVRSKIYGILRNKKGTSEKDVSEEDKQLIEQVKNMHDRINETISLMNNAIRYSNSLGERLNDLDQRFDKLVAMLALNRVVDCKHLGTPHKNGDKK